MRTIRWGGRGAKEGWQHERQQRILGMEIPKGGNDVQEGELVWSIRKEKKKRLP